MRRHVVTLTVTITLIVVAFVATLVSDNRPELGLDLQGGISVVLFPVEGSDLSGLDTAVDIISNRVDALGVVEPEVNRQGDTIVIDLPGAKDRDEALAVVGRTAELRFRPVIPGGYIRPKGAEVTPEETTTVPGATTTMPGATTTTLPGASTTTPATTAPPATETTAGEGATGAARTVSTANVASVRPAQETPTTTTAPATTAPPGGPETTAPAGEAPAGSVPGSTVAPDLTCDDVLTPREDDVADQVVWLPALEEDGRPAGCYQLGPAVLTGKSVKTASAGRYSTGGGYSVDLTFRGDDFVEKVAIPYVGQQVAIVLDGAVYSAPTIKEGITGREVQITGSFTQGEAEDLALVLRYGSLPVQFDEAEQTVQSISPSLGKDQLRSGIIAGAIGIALVALYMILYYRLLGLVVWLGLVLTGLIFFSLVSYLSAAAGLTLTLAGVTGLIVSVGVTVDSYVVYFERLKDEGRTGKTIRSSVDVGFRRAFRTIVAADLVSLLGAAVLYALAAGSVRGFAFFLGLSTVIDLAIAYFVMYPAVALLARRPKLVRLPGIGIAAGLDVREARA